MGFACLLNSTGGRIFRIVAGMFFIVFGLSLHSTLGYILAIWGLVPLSAGLFDFCVMAPLFRTPFSGKKIRALCAARR